MPRKTVSHADAETIIANVTKEKNAMTKNAEVLSINGTEVAKVQHIDLPADATIHASVADVMAAKAEAVKAAQSAERKAAKAKVAKAPAVKAERVPFAEVIALLTELEMTRTQLAQATGKSPSLVTEWTGGGRKTGLNVAQWPTVQKAARAWAKKSVK